MANRPVYCVKDTFPFYKETDTEFEFFNGFSIQQKQRCIKSLHDAFLRSKPEAKVLEVSRKSADEIGTQLSAFNLTYDHEGKAYPVECLFQGSKVFEGGKLYQDLYDKTPKEAKQDERLKSSGAIVGFKLFDIDFPSEPKTLFYNFLYISALNKNEELKSRLLEYDAFTDIEFNPKKSLNCQAMAVAIFVGLCRNGLIEDALKSAGDFKRIVYGIE